MSSNANRSPVELDTTECEACGKPYAATPRSEVYSIVIDQERPDVASFRLCPSCAVALADEIAANVPDVYSTSWRTRFGDGLPAGPSVTG